MTCKKSYTANSTTLCATAHSVVALGLCTSELAGLCEWKSVLLDCYVYGYVHCWCILIIVKRDATQSSQFIILQVHCTCFGCQPHPSSRVHKTVTTASGTVQLPVISAARWREVAAQKIWPVPEAVVTVLCTPDDGCGWHPKHVQWTWRIINRLLCVASRWTIINIAIVRPNARNGSDLEVTYSLFLLSFNSPFRLTGSRCDVKIATTAINKPPLRSQYTAVEGLLVNCSNSASHIAFYCTGWMWCDWLKIEFWNTRHLNEVRLTPVVVAHCVPLGCRSYQEHRQLDQFQLI